MAACCFLRRYDSLRAITATAIKGKLRKSAIHSQMKVSDSLTSCHGEAILVCDLTFRVSRDCLNYDDVRFRTAVFSPLEELQSHAL